MSLAELKQRTIAPPQAGFTGLWRTIEWQPDLFSPQRFIVGITVESPSTDARSFRLMDQPTRLDCFFRPWPITQDFNWALAAARRALTSKSNAPIPCHNITLSDGLFISGESLESTAETLFNEMVLAARPWNDSGPADAVGPDTDVVRKEVNALLKRMVGLDFERIVREKGETLSEHFFDVTLAPDHGAGSVVSACFKSPTSIELHLLRAAQDTSAYATAQHRDSKAIFVRMPSTDARLSPKDRAAIEKLTGEACWKLECAGFRAPRHDSNDAIACEIRDWATPLLVSS